MRGRRPDTSKMQTLITHDLLPLEEGIKRVLKEGLFELNQ